jgi:small subunit ribosomal protein S16
VIEEVGIYQPTENPSLIRITSERVQYWLGVGAQPSETVLALLKVTGDWQKFKGLPGAEGTLQQPESKAAFVAEDKGSVIIPEAITPKAEKTEDSAESEAAAEEPAEAEAEKAE